VEIIGQVLNSLAEPVAARTSVPEPEQQTTNSWLGWIYEGLGLGGKPVGKLVGSAPEFNSQLERVKLTQFLNLSRNHLVKLFNVRFYRM